MYRERERDRERYIERERERAIFIRTYIYICLYHLFHSWTVEWVVSPFPFKEVCTEAFCSIANISPPESPPTFGDSQEQLRTWEAPEWPRA